MWYFFSDKIHYRLFHVTCLIQPKSKFISRTCNGNKSFGIEKKQPYHWEVVATVGTRKPMSAFFGQETRRKSAQSPSDSRNQVHRWPTQGYAYKFFCSGNPKGTYSKSNDLATALSYSSWSSAQQSSLPLMSTFPNRAHHPLPKTGSMTI